MIGAWQGKEALGNQRRSFTPSFGAGVEEQVAHEVAVAEVVVGGDGHAVLRARTSRSAVFEVATRLLPSAG